MGECCFSVCCLRAERKGRQKKNKNEENGRNKKRGNALTIALILANSISIHNYNCIFPNLGKAKKNIIR